MIFTERIGYFRNRDKNCPYMKWHISKILGIDSIGRPITKDVGIYFQNEWLAKDYCEIKNREYEEERKRVRECVESAEKWFREHHDSICGGCSFSNIATFLEDKK